MKQIPLFIFIFYTLFSNSQTITVSGGGWTPAISSSDILDAGSDYNTNVSSNTEHSTINITGTSLLCLGILVAPDYQIRINRQDNNWNNLLQLFLRRTGDGEPTLLCLGCFIENGNNYIEIESIDKYFFNIRGCYSNVPIQYELRGLSVLIPPDNYSTEVIYTITNF
ncbi:hypothetical protein C7448_10996 [Tenacibaculum gallaicum]|uniref:Uncharacterized protein n=1 Tax=Tenacibaculum gallaicum TaxID=561505 RepID=A0A3E0HH89_9FLAO|nr:hypothetical protein C7448_10996 [Tenacibaculum gallaicum]